MTLSVQQLSNRLQLVHDRFANQINSRDLGPDYNFLERQQAGRFIDAIADAFGWTNQQMDAYTHEYSIDNLPGIQEDDIDFDDDMNLVPKTHGWIDCAFIPHVIWEMKSPTNANGSPRPLTAQNETQLWRYWTALPAPKPRYLILSNFREFRIFDSTLGSGAEAIHVFPLSEIHEYSHCFPFFSENPNAAIANAQEQISVATANNIVDTYLSMVSRGVNTTAASSFVIRCALLMYLEDIRVGNGYLIPREDGIPTGRFTHALYLILNNENAHVQTHLIPLMQAFGQDNNQGIYQNLPLVSEEWFGPQNIPQIDLEECEVELLLASAMSDWNAIDPVIFGNISEACYSHEERLARGIYYTCEADIMRIVRPLIVEPWERKISQIEQMPEFGGDNSPSRVRKRTVLGFAIAALRHFKVLDPACGSANFLYIAYREIKRLEARMFELFNDISLHNTQFNLDAFTFIYPENMFGFEIEEWSASVGRLVMAVAGLTTAIDFDIGQAPLPLRNSANIRCVDALLDVEQEVQREWDNFAIQSIEDPRPNFVNIIIGNPPFKGGRKLRDALGADYTELLFTQYNGQLKRSADLATYWVRKAEDCLIQGRCDAFGLVTTSSITQPASVGVLGYGLENGLVISLAHRIRDWPNSGASQTISITCMERDDEGAQFADSLNTIPGMNEEIVSGILNSGLDNFLSILEYDSIGMNYGIEQLSLIEGINEELAIRIMNSARNHCNLRISQPPRLATERNGGLEECDRIYKHLRNFDMQPMLDPLAANMGRCPQGYKGFYKENPGGLMITEAQAQNLLEQSNGDNGPDNSDVVLNFAPGSYMDNRQYEWIIDFKEMAYDNAIEYLGPFAHLEENGRQDNVLSKDEDSYGRLFPVWWQPWRPRPEIRDAIETHELEEYFIRREVSMIHHFEVVPSNIVPDGTLQVITHDERWRLGVLLSDVHRYWWQLVSGSRGAGDRYQSYVYESFPFVEPTDDQRTAIEQAVQAYYALIDNLLTLPQYDNLRAVLVDNPAVLRAAKDNITRAVYPLYGLQAEETYSVEQIENAVAQIKETHLLIDEVNFLNQQIESLDRIPGVGENAVSLLTQSGINTYQQIVDAQVVGLIEIEGIGSAKATRIIDYCNMIFNRIAQINQILNNP